MREFRCLPLDFGSPIMERFLRDQCPYDGVLSFAAIKHVRSEKDAYSILQMLETNVLKHARLLGWLEDGRAPSRFFAVSTDKAANPVNLMGASKRLMEDLLCWSATRGSTRGHLCALRKRSVFGRQPPSELPEAPRKTAAACRPERHETLLHLPAGGRPDLPTRQRLCACWAPPRSPSQSGERSSEPRRDRREVPPSPRLRAKAIRRRSGGASSGRIGCESRVLSPAVDSARHERREALRGVRWRGGARDGTWPAEPLKHRGSTGVSRNGSRLPTENRGVHRGCGQIHESGLACR